MQELQSIADIVRQYYQTNQIPFLEKTDCFETLLILGDDLPDIFQYVGIAEKSLHVLLMPDMEIPASAHHTILMYLNTLNRHLRIGGFFLDMEQNRIMFRTGLICADTIPSAMQTEHIIVYSTEMAEDMAEILPRLLTNQISVEEAVYDMLSGNE